MVPVYIGITSRFKMAYDGVSYEKIAEIAYEQKGIMHNIIYTVFKPSAQMIT